MEPKSIEAYKRELMEMFRRAKLSNPEYETLTRSRPAVPETTPTPSETISEIVEEIESESDFMPMAIPVVTVMPVPEVRMPLAAQTDTETQNNAARAAENRTMTAPQTEVRPQAETTETAQTPTLNEETVEITYSEEEDTPAQNDATQTAPPTVQPVLPEAVQNRLSDAQAAADSLPQPTTEYFEPEQPTDMGTGELIVSVTTGRGTMPVAGAKVTVVTPTKSGNKIMAQVTTDNSGRTENISLPAPVRAFPLYPEPIGGGDQSAIYTVVVDAPGYVTTINKEVAVFDGVTSVQRIDMMVAMAADGDVQPRVITEVNRNAF